MRRGNGTFRPDNKENQERYTCLDRIIAEPYKLQSEEIKLSQGFQICGKY